MAEGKQYQVSLTIDANVDRAKKAMKQLQSDLDKLSTGALTLTPATKIDKDLIQASQAAAQLKVNLESAFNVKTGNLDLVKFNQSMKSAGMSAQKYQEALSSLGPAGDQAFSQLAMAVAKADAPFARVNSKLNEFATSLKNTAKWQISSSILHGLTGSINQAFSYAQQLNSSLNDIRIVTGASADEMAKFAAQANQAAKSLSTSTRSYADAALIFYQQGLGDAAVKERTDAVIKMANVTKDSAAEVSSYMTAIWNNFDDGSKSLEHYADVMTALGAATASSTAEIADGLEKFASIGKTIGLSYDYATSALATIVSQTRQSADTVGTGLRTIFSRLQGLSLGETLEDGVNLNKYSKALGAVGVSILDATGNMKDMDSILDSLASKWDNLTNAQKTALAQTVGGVRQYTTLISLMDNWDSMETNLTTAKSSSGALQEQANIYAESWDAAKNRVKASAEAIYSSLINDDFFIGLNNGFAGFLDQVNNLIEGLGGLKGVLMSLTPIVTALFRNQINSGIRSMVSSIQNFTPGGRAKNEAVRTSFVNQAMNMHRNDASIGGAAMADQQRRVAQMQFAYMQGSSKMTEEQRSNAQYLMQQYEGVTARVQKAGDEANNASQRARDVDIRTQTAVSEKGKDYAKKEQEKQDAKKQEAINEAEEKRQSQLDEIERKRQERVQELQEQKKRQVKSRRGPIDNEIRIENEKAAAARERIDREYNKKVKAAEKTHATDSADIAKKQQRAEAAREKFTQQVRAEAFTKETTAAVMDVKINGKEDIDAAKERLQALAAMIKKVAAEQDIDLGSPDEDGSYAQALQAIETAANDANASVESLQEAQNGLNTAFEGGQFGPKPVPGEKSAEEEYSEAMDDLGATADEKHMGEIKSAAAAEGTAIAKVAEESAVAEQAAGKLNETLNEMSSVKLDFASGFTASLSAITAVGAALSSVQGLMDLWGDSSASVGEKLLGTLTTVATVAGSLGSAFSGTNGQLLTMMGNLLLTKLGFTGVTGAMAGTAAASGPAAGGLGTVGTVGSAAGFSLQVAFWPIVVVMLAIAAAVALVIGVMAGIQALSNIYNADAIAAEQAAEAARNLASAYGEAQEKYNSMIQTMDNYSSARAALDSLTEGTEAYNAALSQANEAGLALINSMPDLKAGEDYRWENGELIIDQDAMDRVKKAEAGKVAEARAASLMADAHASTAKAQADRTEFLRENDQSGWAGAGAGAALGATYGMMLGPWGAAIGGLLGGVVGLGATLFNNKTENDAESERIDKLIADYETLGEKAFDDAHLKELGFTNVTDEYREGLMEVVKATSQAAQQTSLAARMAAEELLALDDEYNRIKDKDTKDNIGAAGGRVYQSLEDKYYEEYLAAAGDRGWLFNTGTDTSEQAFKEYAELMGLKDYDATDFIGRGKDGSVKYTYTDENGEKQEKTVTAKEMARRLAAKKAADEFGNSSAFLMDEFDRLDREGKHGLADFLGGDLTQSTRSEWGQIAGSFNSAKSITAGSALSYLGSQFGDGNGVLDDAEAQKYGYESAAKMAEAFKDEYNRTMTAWNDIKLPGGLDEWSEKLSLEAAQKLENITENLNLGPLGDSAGDAFAEGLNQMLEGVDADQQTAALSQLMSIDWSSWDALSQADAILQEFGVDLDLTSEQWVAFASNMRLASRSIPDFSKLKSDFTSISKIIGDLDFGEAISEEDYQTLIAYNQEWSKFFVMQADGSRKFIGNSKDMAAATHEMALEQRDLLNTYSVAAENDNISGFDWNQELNTDDKLAQAKKDFEALLKSENGGAELTAVMEALGYGNFDWQNATAEQLKAMFDAIYSAVDPTYISQIDDEFQEMYASTATSLSELQSMLSSNTIDGDTYSKSLIAMASGYEYCTSAIKAYQEALDSGVGIEEAQANLERAVAAEQEAAKYETAYSSALSGRDSMSVADLNALQEADPDLYYQYLTATEDEWYEASYEAYRNWLEARMAGYSEDSAEYKALMMERNQLDADYYEVQEEKALKHLELLREKYDENIENITTAQSSIASIFEGDTTPTFSALGELRRELLELGYDATQVGEIIQNLGKSDKEDKTKEDILTQLGLETELSLNKLTQMGKMERNYGNAIGVTIEDYQFAPSVPSEGKEMKVPATSNPTVTPETPSDIPGLKWENNQYNFKAAGGGSIVINGTTGKGIKEVGENSITLIDPTPGGGTIEVNATEGTPLAASLTEKGWVIKDPTQNGAGEILVNGKPGTNTGVTLQGNVWKLTSVSSEGKQASISVVGSPNTTTGVKYENNQWQITAVTSEGASATIAVGGDGGDASVEFNETTGWKITGTTVGGGTSTINVASDGGTKGVTWTEKGWQLVGEDPTGKTSSITVSGDTDPSTGVDYVANKGWVISGTVNGEDTSITVSGAADDTTVSFDGKKYTLKQKGEGSGSLVVDAKSFDSTTIESLGEDGGYIIKGLGTGSGSLTVGAVPDNSTVELVEGEGGGYKLVGTVNGEAFECPVTAEEVANGAKVHWVEGKGWVLEQTVETKYETTSGQAPETEVHQTVYVSYVDEETQAGLHRSAQLRRTLEWLGYDGKVSSGYFSNIYDGTKTSKIYTWGAEVNRTSDKSTWGFDTAREFFRSLYGVGDKNNIGADEWADLMGDSTGNDSALSLAMGALEYGPGAGQWLKDFGNFGYSRASYKYATESIGEQLNEWRAKIINSMSGITDKTGLDKWGSFNATELLNMGLTQEEIDAIVAEYNQVYEALMAQEGMTVERAVQGASEAITDNLTQYLNADSTYVYGMNLYQGLIQGWQDAYGNATTFADTALSVLGDLANAFEIHSPSRATRRMGVWLMQGLNEGWKDTTFDANNIGDMALSAIKTSLSEAFGGEGINWLEYLQTDKDGNLIKLMTQEQLDSIWGDRETNDYLTGEENDTNAKTNSLNRIATMFDKDGTVGLNADEMNAFLAELPQQLQEAVKQWQAQNPEAQLTMDVIAELAINTEDLADNWDETMLQDLLLGEASGEALANYITGGYLDTITDPTTKALFVEAKKDFFEKNDMGIKADVDINADNAQAVLDHIYQYMAENLDKYRTLIDAEIDNMLTKWTTALGELYAEETEYAKNLVTMWTETYSTIAKIRTALLSDSNATVMSVVGDDIDSLTKLIANARMNGTTDAAALFNKWYYGTGMTETDASITAFNAPTQLWGESEYGLISKAFSFDANGMINFGQSWTDFDTRQTEIVSGLVDKYLVGDGSIVQDQINKLYEAAADTSDPESASSAQLLLEILTNKGIITADKNQDNQVTGYSINANAGETQGITIKDLLVEEVGLDEAGFYNAQNALWAYESARRNREGQAAADRGEARLEAATNKIDLLTRAASGEEAGSFSAQEQAEIYKILGINPSSVSFEELLTSMPDLIVRALNTATTEAETAGKTAAAEYYLAGKGYVNVNGQWRQYSYDPQEMVTKADGTQVARYQVGANGQVQEFNQATQQYETATIENLTVTIDGATLTQALTEGGFTASVNTDGSLNVSDVGSYVIPDNDNLNGAAAGNVGADTATKIEEAWTELDEYIRLAESAGILMTAQEIMSDRGLATLEEAVAIQRQYALQLKAMEAGLKALNSNGKSWIKTLKKQGASLEEQADAIKNLRKNYADVLGLTDKQAKKLSKTFLENEDNLRLVEKAAEDAGAEGQKALDQLQVAAAKDLYKESGLKEMSAEVAALAEQVSQLNLDAGDMVTGTDAAYGTLHSFWNNVLQDAIASGKSFQDAVGVANDAMNNLGYGVEPLEFETVEMTADELKQHLSIATNTAYDATGKPIQVSDVDSYYEKGGSTTYAVQIPKGKGGSSSGPTFTKNAERPGGGGGGGGGGDSRRRYIAKAKPEDYKERYHEINNAIDEVTDALDRLNKQQDRAWGAERLKSMQAESAELKKQADLIRQKTQEAQDYLESDLNAALEAGWTFDEEGNVSNYEDHWDNLLADYNNAVEEYNNMSIAEQEAIDKKFEEANDKYYEAKAKGDKAGMEEWGEYINPETEVAFGSYEEYLKYKMLDAPTEALEQYEETMEELEQLGIDYDDVLNALYDNFIDQVQTKWDTANEIADANIEYLEHKISRLEDNAYKAAETIGLMSDKMDYTQDKFNAATTALDDLLKGYDSAWSAEAIMAGQLTAEDLAGAGMDANAVEMVQSIMSELMNLEQEMTDTLIESFESMTEAFDEFNEDLDRYISTIEHAQSITSTYRNIIDLTGKSMSGFSTELLKAFNSATIDQAKANMKSNKTKYDTVQAEYDEAYQQYLNAQTLHAQGKLNDAALKAAKEAFEATQDNLNEAQEAYVASWEAALQAVADAYTSTMEGVMDEIGKNLTNGLAGGLDALQERMDRMKTKDSNYVDDYEKIYQLTKLTRDLETQIDNTSNVRAQKELLKFQKEINSILQSDKKLSEYDIDYLQKKYDLKLAEIALEDAQNAKSQVTMRRDSEGNYNYVYTADENAVAEAEAEYATKLYEMQKANDEYITSLSDSIVSLEAEMKDALLALDPTQFASEEEFNAAVEEIIAFYTEQMSYHQEQLETVLGNNKELYEKDMVWYNKYANYKMADAASFIDSWNETLLAQATGFETMEDLFGTFFSQAETAQSESVTAYRNYVDAINAINAEAGHPTETLAQSLTEDIEAMTDQAEQAATDMEQHAETIVGEITSIGQAIEDMAKKFGVEIVGMAKQTDLLVAALTDMLEIMGKAGDIELEEGLLADIEARRQAREQEYASQSFDTGGYTGAWGPEGKLAWLHQKELVLNAADTENILASVGILRQIANTIDLNALTSAGGFISLMSSGISGNRETLQQEVHIEASFPAVTDKNQIEDAFTDLVNLAAQYANRK